MPQYTEDEARAILQATAPNDYRLWDFLRQRSHYADVWSDPNQRRLLSMAMNQRLVTEDDANHVLGRR